MKNLRILVYADIHTNTDILRKVLSEFEIIEYEIITDDLLFTNQLTAMCFDLLIIDLDLPKETYKRTQLMMEMVYPDAAYTEIDLNQEDFLRFKIKSLIGKWIEANTEGVPKFFDNPSF